MTGPVIRGRAADAPLLLAASASQQFTMPACPPSPPPFMSFMPFWWPIVTLVSSNR